MREVAKGVSRRKRKFVYVLLVLLVCLFTPLRKLEFSF